MKESNPYHPFTWVNQEVRLTGDIGGCYEADVWESRYGWRWSARATVPGGDPADPTWDTIAPADALATEADAMAAATEWLRSRYSP